MPLIVGGELRVDLFAPLIERRGLKKERRFFCQLPLVEKFRKNRWLRECFLSAFFRYLGKGGVGRAVVQVDFPPDLKVNLADKRIFVEAMGGWRVPESCAWFVVGIWPTTFRSLSDIKEWVEIGNVFWVYGLELENTAKLNGLLKGVTCEPFPEKGQPVVVNKEISLTDGILNQFLYWTEPHGVFTYSFAKLIKPSEWALGLVPKAGGYKWEALTSPALLMVADVGKGRIVVDTMNWAGITGVRKISRTPVEYAPLSQVNSTGQGLAQMDTDEKMHEEQIANQRITNNAPDAVGFDENQEMAIRLFSGLLTNLGVRLEGRGAIQIEAENMEVKTPGQPLIRNRNHNYWAIFKNNLLAQDFEWPDGKEPGTESCVIEVKARCRVKSDVLRR